jgi:hypothetical protein
MLGSVTHCGRSSVGRASASQAEGREFEPRRPLSLHQAKSRHFMRSLVRRPDVKERHRASYRVSSEPREKPRTCIDCHSRGERHGNLLAAIGHRLLDVTTLRLAQIPAQNASAGGFKSLMRDHDLHGVAPRRYKIRARLPDPQPAILATHDRGTSRLKVTLRFSARSPVEADDSASAALMRARRPPAPETKRQVPGASADTNGSERASSPLQGSWSA